MKFTPLKPKSKTHEELDYSRITPNIYIGTNQCCMMHFDRGLLNKGIRADISLEAKRLDMPFGVDYYLWLPTKDHHPVKPKQLEIGINCLDGLLKFKEKVYIHCEHGHGRAPFFVAAYFIIKKGMSAKKAVALIKKRRPSMHLTAGQLKALNRITKKGYN